MERSKFRQPQAHGIQHYQDLKSVPIDNSQRRCTDILCIIIGLGFTIVMAVFAIACWNQPQYLKLVFPADTDGVTCGYQHPGYKYIYFANINEMKNRLCVKSCPTTADKPLECKKTSTLGCEFGGDVQFYESQHVDDRYGFFCMPKDPAQRKVLKEKMNSHQREIYYNSMQTIGHCLLIVGVLSLVYMLLVQFIPRIMNRVAVVVGAIALVAFTITVAVYPSELNSSLRWVVFAIALVFVLILVCVMAKYFQTWGMNGIYLQFGTKFTAHRIYPFVLPIVFLALTLMFYFFQILQMRSYWSFGELVFDPADDIYYGLKDITNNVILTILQVIQLIWGTMFLKQAFNYLISAEAVDWYYKNDCKCLNAAFTLVCKHLGSVIAASFMSGFFGIADLICDSLIPPLDQNNGCFYCINRFAGFFDLVRSDALTLVYLSGNAYCNSARYAEYLTNKSSNTVYSQSASRIYRFCAHFALAGVVCLVAFWWFGIVAEVSIVAMLVLLLLCLIVATFFISLHADAGEAILILYLMEFEFSQNRRAASKTDRFDQINKEANKYLNESGIRERTAL